MRQDYMSYHGQSEKSRSFVESLLHAIRGTGWAVICERNVRIQLVALVGVVLVAWLAQVALWQWIVLLSVSVLVFAFEMFNSALEALADAVYPEYNEHIQRAKDMSAAAVLLVSCLAVVIGLVILGPFLYEWLASVGGVLVG